MPMDKSAQLSLRKKGSARIACISLSLDAPIAADSDECLLQRLPARQGDFTNSVLFWDYIRRLPRRLFQLAWRLVNRDSLEEARSAMGLTEQELCLAVGQLRDALTRYFTI